MFYFLTGMLNLTSKSLIKRNHRLLVLLSLTIICWGTFALHAEAQTSSEIAAQGSQAMQRQDYPAAEQAYEKLIGIAPNVAEVYSNLGIACFLQNKLTRAEEAFNKALALKPGLFVPNLLLGNIYLKRSRYKEALKNFNDALVIQPGDERAERLLPAALAGLKQYDQAISIYQSLISKFPKDVDLFYGLGRLYLELGQTPYNQLAQLKDSGFVSLILADQHALRPEMKVLALKEYRQAIDKSPGMPGPRTVLGNLQLESNNWDAAEKSFTEETALDSFSYKALLGLSAVTLHRGEVKKAISKLDEAFTIRPEFFRPFPLFTIDSTDEQLQNIRKDLEREAAERQSFAVFFLLSEVLNRLHATDQASLWQERAQEKREALIAQYESKARVALRNKVAAADRERGLQYLKEKRLELGAQILQKKPIGKADSTVIKALTLALLELNKNEEVVGVLKDRKENQDPEIKFILGKAYKNLAFRNLERIQEIEPNSARVHQLLGDAYLDQEYYLDATEEYLQAVAVDPANAEFWFLLGNSYFKQQNYAKAVEAYERATELDPFDSQAYLMKGDAFVQLLRPEEAIKSLQRSMELNSKSTQKSNELMGKAYSILNKPEEAIRFLELAAGDDRDGTVNYQLFILYRNTHQPEKAKSALANFQKIKQVLKEQQDARLPAALLGTNESAPTQPD